MRRPGVLRFAAYGAELLILYVLGRTPGFLPPFLGGLPVLVLPAAVSIAFFEEERAALLIGVFCGLLMDAGNGGLLGFQALLLGAGCYAVSYLASEVLRTSLLSALLATLGLTGGVLLFQWGFGYAAVGYPDPLGALWQSYLPRLPYTAVFAVPFYYWNRFFATRLRAPNA